MNLAALANKYPFLQNNIAFWEKYSAAREALFRMLPAELSAINPDDSAFLRQTGLGQPLLTVKAVKLNPEALQKAFKTFAAKLGLETPADLPAWNALPLAGRLDAPQDQRGFLIAEVHAAVCSYLEAVLFPDDDIKGWMEPYCPVCGAGAAMGLINPDGKKTLVCSHCHTAWPYLRSACGLCGHSAERGASYVSADELPDWRIELCESCEAYLKVFDMRNAFPETSLFPLLYLTTWELDLSVKDRGYQPSFFHVFERAGWLNGRAEK